jgi:signal transduction histidine kinase/ligand-binding sensor domain-containing protein/DNA-binding response OmpR family regulator
MKHNDSPCGRFGARITGTIICLALLWLSSTLHAQSSQLPPGFERITTEDGLSQGFIGAILQDRRGFMWFGTRDGLNRYDGYNFKVYRYDPFDSTTISGNWITALYEDAFGYLWVGTRTGLNRFDPRTETFFRIPFAPGKPNSLSDPVVSAIAAAKMGSTDSSMVLWIGTNKGLNRLVLQVPSTVLHIQRTEGPDWPDRRYTISQFFFYPEYHSEPRANNVRTLFVDHANRLWIGTAVGIYRAKSNPAQPVHFQRLDDRLGNFGIPARFAFVEDSHDTLWIGSSLGLTRVAPPDTALREIHNYANPEHQAWARDEEQPITGVIDLVFDRQGRIWVAHTDATYIFYPGTGSFQHLRKKLGNNYEPATQFRSNFFTDHNGLVWIGSFGYGLLKYDFKRRRMHNLTNTEVEPVFPGLLYISRFGQLPSGEVVAFSYTKPFRLDPAQDRLTPFTDLRMKGAEILERDQKGGLWIVENDALFHLPYGGQRLVKIYPEANGPQTRVMRLTPFQDRNSDLWFVSSWAERDAEIVTRLLLHCLRLASGTIVSYPVRIPETLKITGDAFRNLICDPEGRIWLATYHGLLCIEPSAEKMKIYLTDQNNRKSLNQDNIKVVQLDPILPDRFLWIGTEGGGLNRLDMTNDTFVYYQEKDGLPNNVIYGILADDHGNLWMSTNRGLSKAVVDGQSRNILRFKNFHANDGLQGDEFNTGAYFKNDKDEMFFGGVNGFNWFHPDSLRNNPSPPQVVITDFQIHGKSVSPKTPDSPLRFDISATEKIVLPYDQNVVAFEFAALDYSNPRENLYSHKMAPFEHDWSLPSNDRRVIYSQLSPGDYVFHVRGSNSDGVWNEEGTSISLTILPPWWRTWWAYSFYTFFIMFMLHFLRRYEQNRQALKHDAELQRVEREKLQEVDALKSRFFANISHEFRTPLTLILGQIEGLLAKDRNAEDQGKLHMAFRNAKQLLRLINQLLDLSKIEAGRMTLNAAPGNVVPLLRSLTASFESLATQKNLDLRFECAHDSIVVNFESEKIEKIIYNLLSNAMKFTPEGGKVSVQLSVTSRSEAEIPAARDDQFPVTNNNQLITDNCLLITVRDNGIGIPQDRLAYVFDRFYQVDASRTREHEGTGIGLALTKELVELHGGTIAVASAEGAGSTFVVKLPIISDQLSVVSIEQSATSIEHLTTSIEQPVASIEHPATSHAFILIIEDNADVRSFIREHLQDTYRVIEAADGEDGFIKAQEYIPDLIISDVMMPKLDGYELARRIRAHELTSHIPIIMLTAKAAEDEKLEGLETGVDAYLIKPFSIKELQVRVRKLIEMRRKLRAQMQHRPVVKASEVAVTPVDQKFLERLQKIAEENLADEDFQVEELCKQVGMSQRQLHRKLGALLDHSPKSYLRRLRLDRAKQLLEKNAGTVSEIAFEVGYGNVSAFSRAFREVYGNSPSELLKKEE